MLEKNFNHLNLWLPSQLKRMGWSVEQLAQRTNTSRATIYNWLTDADRPSEQKMVKVCQVLGVPFEEGLMQYVPKRIGRPRGS